MACAGRLSLRGQSELADLVGRWIEAADPARPVAGVPDSPRWRDDNAMWPGVRRWRGDVGHLAASRIEPSDVAVVLVGVPHDAIGSDGRVVRKRVRPWQHVLHHCPRRGQPYGPRSRRCTGNGECEDGESAPAVRTIAPQMTRRRSGSGMRTSGEGGRHECRPYMCIVTARIIGNTD